MKKKAKTPKYKLWLQPEVHDKRKKLPGNIRHRIKQLIDELGNNPRSVKSTALRLPGSVETKWEVRRVRLANWRIIYAINNDRQEIGIIAIRKRPPYEYEDLEQLLADLKNE